MRRGSLQYWPRKRARQRLPRLRSAPGSKEARLSNIIAYKVGTTHVGIIDDSESSSKGQEISRACTILAIPKIEVYGLRLYSNDKITGYRHCVDEIYSKSSAQKLNMKKIKNDETKINDLMKRISEYSDVTALLVAYPKGIGTGQHHPDRFEVHLGSATPEEKMKFISGLLGKEIKASEVFKAGEHIDVSSITKGKGWQGAIRRFGAPRQDHKATQKIRHVGPLGAFTPAYVMYTIPHPGQMGFHYRTEHNKRILSIGIDPEKINPKAGFKNYGVVRNDFMMIEGSVPGTAKRLVRLRKSITDSNKNGIKEPKITYVASVGS